MSWNHNKKRIMSVNDAIPIVFKDVEAQNLFRVVEAGTKSH